MIVLTELANRFRLHKLDHVEKFVMSYGGLRGAVAFALVLLIDPKKVHKQPLFVTATISVVYFTVFFQVNRLCGIGSGSLPFLCIEPCVIDPTVGLLRRA